VADAHWRDWFRSTAAHNTIRIDGIDQAVAAGPFRWRNHPEVRILSWTSDAAGDMLEAECRYAGFVHRRRVEFQKPDLVSITDHVDGPPGQHLLEQFWHLGSPAARDRLTLAEGAELLDSWRSTVFGEKHPAPLVRVTRRGVLPMRLEARINLG
ncbi:MAG: heparinase II/III family protein, partial [Bryobacteraceae bacterium]